MHNSNDDIRILHIRVSSMGVDSPTGGTTIAYHWKHGMSHIRLSTAVCSLNDRYNKTVGRSIALENFLDGQSISIPYPKHLSDVYTPSDYLRIIFDVAYSLTK